MWHAMAVAVASHGAQIVSVCTKDSYCFAVLRVLVLLGVCRVIREL